MSADADIIWKRIKLLANEEVREIMCALFPTLQGNYQEFRRLSAKLEKLEHKIPYSTANQLINRMKDAKMVETRGGPRTGLEVRLKEFEIPTMAPKTVYTLHKGRPPLPSS